MCVRGGALSMIEPKKGRRAHLPYDSTQNKGTLARAPDRPTHLHRRLDPRLLHRRAEGRGVELLDRAARQLDGAAVVAGDGSGVGDEVLHAGGRAGEGRVGVLVLDACCEGGGGGAGGGGLKEEHKGCKRLSAVLSSRKRALSEARPLPSSREDAPWMMALPISPARCGSSPNVSKERDQSGCVLMPRMGAKSHGMPPALVSLAVMLCRGVYACMHARTTDGEQFFDIRGAAGPGPDASDCSLIDRSASRKENTVAHSQGKIADTRPCMPPPFISTHRPISRTRSRLKEAAALICWGKSVAP